MKAAPARLLIVDDETGILETLEILLSRHGYTVETACSGRHAVQRIEEGGLDLILSDIRMPGITGLDVLSAARAASPEASVILMTAQASLQSAVRAVNEGAFYYLQKPFSNEEVLDVCRRASEARTVRSQIGVAEDADAPGAGRRRPTHRADAPVGCSRAFAEVIELAETVAPSDSTVLVSGESGTGKEVVARYLHSRSGRAGQSFLSVNCGALPESLLESELFGHVRGSFTGAVRDKQGLLVAASGGTLLLDEIGEMTPATQVKLLRAVQEREVVPVGAVEPVSIDVRVIAATNRDLEEEIRRGRFRSDLYYRLNVIQLHIPPLRDRRADIPPLAAHFLERIGGVMPDHAPHLSEEALEVLCHYDWPGNVRELQNALERAAVVSLDDEIGVEDLPARVSEAPEERLVDETPPVNPSMEVIERAYIQWVLQAERGNKTRAAEVLGIDPSTLYRKLSRYGLNVPTGSER